MARRYCSKPSAYTQSTRATTYINWRVMWKNKKKNRRASVYFGIESHRASCSDWVAKIWKKRSFKYTKRNHQQYHKTQKHYVKRTNSLIPTEIFSMFAEARRQYDVIRNTKKKFFLYYSFFQKTRQKSYSHVKEIQVTSTCTKSYLQPLVDLLSIYLERGYNDTEAIRKSWANATYVEQHLRNSTN